MERDERPPPSRRRFLRDAAILTGFGGLAGCLDTVAEAVDVDVQVPGGGRADNASPSAEGTPVDERVRTYERAIHERVNQVRQGQGLEPLEYNEELARVARKHSIDMVERDYFAHVSPEGAGPNDRLDDFFPGRCRTIGENIANVGRRPDGAPEAVAERIVSGWMASPGHRKNVLREGFDEEGIGVAIEGDDRVMATQNFCGRADLFEWVGIDG